MQLIIYRIFLKLLDENYFLPPLPKKNIHNFISWISFEETTKGGEETTGGGGGGGVEETMGGGGLKKQ